MPLKPSVPSHIPLMEEMSKALTKFAKGLAEVAILEVRGVPAMADTAIKPFQVPA